MLQAHLQRGTPLHDPEYDIITLMDTIFSHLFSLGCIFASRKNTDELGIFTIRAIVSANGYINSVLARIAHHLLQMS